MSDAEYFEKNLALVKFHLSKNGFNLDSARNVLDEMSRSGTSNRREVLRLQAICSAAESNFPAARELWESYSRKFEMDADDLTVFGKVLENCGLVAEAIKLYQSASLHNHNGYSGLINESNIHSTLGHFPAALRVLDQAVQSSAGSRSEAKIRLLRADRAMLADRLLDAFSDYVAVARMLPKKSEGVVGQIKVHLRNYDRASAEATLSLCKKRFPQDAGVVKAEAIFVHQYGNDQDFLEFAAYLAALALPIPAFKSAITHSLGPRKNLFTEPFREKVAACLLKTYDANLVREIVAPRSLPTAEERIEARSAAVKRFRLAPDSPAGICARARLAEALISAGSFRNAVDAVNKLKLAVRTWPYPPPVIGAVVEWEAARRGALRDAQQSYRTRRQMVAHRDRSDELECIRLLPSPPPPVVVFCQLRNEKPLLAAFLRHYRSIGVQRFVMIDNGSSDGTFELLLEQPEVEIYRTYSSFRRAGAGNAWITPLIARPDYVNTLCLRVDIDEHFVYPHFETRSVADLWRFMNDEGADVIAGYMVDMLPEKLSDLNETDKSVDRIARYFETPPYSAPSVICPYFTYIGGPRSRILGMDAVLLTKCSGLRGGGAVEPLRISTHGTSPARVSSIRMALLHYKFRPDFFERAKRVAEEHQYGNSSQEFVRYQALENVLDGTLLSETSREYTGSASLIDSGVVRSTAAWDARKNNFRTKNRGAKGPVHLIWSNVGIVRDNWGDKLNPVLVELLSGRPARNILEANDVPKSTPCYSVIGSHLAQVSGRHIVWGTGFINATDCVKASPRQVCAVRGPLSRAMLLAQGIDCPEVYGDPALLLPLLYYPDVAKTHDLGVILHIRDRDIAEMPLETANLRIKIIDITGDIYDVVDQICSCSHIASSSLHGIIAAHAYGVPSVWLKFGDRLRGDGHKFRDYMASIGINAAIPHFVTLDTDYGSLVAESRLPEQRVAIDALIAACPFIDEERKAELQTLALAYSLNGGSSPRAASDQIGSKAL